MPSNPYTVRTDVKAHTKFVVVNDICDYYKPWASAPIWHWISWWRHEVWRKSHFSSISHQHLLPSNERRKSVNDDCSRRHLHHHRDRSHLRRRNHHHLHPDCSSSPLSADSLVPEKRICWEIIGDNDKSETANGTVNRYYAYSFTALLQDFLSRNSPSIASSMAAPRALRVALMVGIPGRIGDIVGAETLAS